jgi:hypothetical protein
LRSSSAKARNYFHEALLAVGPHGEAPFDRDLQIQHQIAHPAPANVRARFAAVVQHLFVFARGILECVRENGHRAKVARFVHLPRDSNGGVGAPRAIERERA